MSNESISKRSKSVSGIQTLEYKWWTVKVSGIKDLNYMNVLSTQNQML
jgi:hypothetical protein